MRIEKLLIIFFVTLVANQNLSSQIIWEDNRSMIYPFLDRMADKGVIELNDVVQPISHQQIISCLDSLRKKSTQLSSLEQKELDFYFEFEELFFFDC
jgi:hypothetical protein